ncbi:MULTISPECIES: beta-ketoacyl synthase N-terminal-like domain-containing protein [Paenibacillus]|uniref:beta-ketoacyl synthase N-terminal-like domain-containing protein n=1 Tax=Paenibacillus TaxID=44249 RepID=UPI0022B86CD4|nr:beta-ketoacyl synthase N-terminal-like domain-containing protein [Paenibacillus caseinilyticus]MCZ8521618.1 beta-ketoacyl synthase N-terminal-like domain-containing protein [Paenibacillus caseinilyticus]
MKRQLVMSLNNPMIRDHRANGQALLPGLAYIDLLYQIFREHGYSCAELELRNLSIHHPLILSGDQVIVLDISAEESASGQWMIRAEGRGRGEDRARQPVLYAAAEMHLVAAVDFGGQLEEDETMEAAGSPIDLESLYGEWRRRNVVHTGFMKAAGHVRETEQAYLAECSVGDEVAGHAKRFMFHPALLDGSGAGIVGRWLSASPQERDSLFLPLFFASFRASALLQTGCTTRVRTSSLHCGEELLTMTMEFFDAQGVKVAELRDFTTKRVRQGDGAARAGSQTSPAGTRRRSAGFAEAQAFLRRLLSDRLDRAVDDTQIHAGYYEMGLDSAGLLAMASAVESRVGSAVSPTLLFEYTTIAQLAEHLASAYPGFFAPAGEEEPLRGASPEHSQPVHSRLELSRPEQSRLEYSRIGAEASGLTAAGSEEAAPFGSTSAAAADGGDEGGIAVIGMAGRYPGAENLDAFWANLYAGIDCVGEVPASRWPWQALEGLESPSGKPLSRWGGFLENPDGFDPQFFRITPREAETMDPQERLFLQTCWETIEDSGYTPSTLAAPRGKYGRRKVGVFAGVMHKDYALLGAESHAQGQLFPLSLTDAPIANRVSYFCNFHGPSMTVDTVCSSSLTAVHLAMQSLKTGECEVALAGGVNLSLHPGKYVSYGLMDMHASDGRCRTFGGGGDGYVSGEGVGAVLLKPLRQAERDGDHIYAVIKGSAVNHGGTVSGITVPSPVGQAELIGECLERAGIDARTITCLEAHGTGTSLGDPIEMQGLGKAFREYTEDVQFCSIGSVKSNIGHAEAAAGVSGLHKVILQLRHRLLVPSLHAEELNPYIDFSGSPFYVQREAKAWEEPVLIRDGRELRFPRRAGISSFGATGSNAHLIVEEYVPEASRSGKRDAGEEEDAGGMVLVPLSAKNKERLLAYAGKLLAFLKGAGSGGLPESLGTEPDSGAREAGQRTEEARNTAQRDLEQRLRSLVAGILGVREELIEAEQALSEYGMEPVHWMRLGESLIEEFGAAPGSGALMQAGSIAAAASRLAAAQPASGEESGMDSVPSVEAAPVEAAPVEAPTPACLQRPDLRADDLAYTLQVGREAMNERAAFIARDLSGLRELLERFLQGTEDPGHIYRGQAKQGADLSMLFQEDEDSGELLQRWLRKGRLANIARLWTQGVDIDWTQLHRHSKPRRIPLPTYPFAKDRYWLPVSESRGSSTASAAYGLRGDASRLPETTAGEAASRSLRLLHKAWEPCPEAALRSGPSGTVIILADHRSDPLALQLAEQLQDSRIAGEAELLPLVEELRASGSAISGLIDLAGCAAKQEASLEWIVPLQRLVEHGSGDGLTLLCVTRGLERLKRGAEPDGTALSGAERAGLYRMLQSEYSHLRSRHVDVEADTDDRTAAEQIAAEFLMDSDDAETAYRQGIRYRAGLREHGEEVGVLPRLPFPQEGVLWITGGTRGLGALCAKHFVQHYGVRRLVLTGREAFPPRELWDDALAQDPGSPAARKIKTVLELEAMGAEVRLPALPLTDERAVRQYAEEVKAAWGPPGGVIHCAGLGDLDTPAFIRKSPGTIREVLAPKMAGTDILCRCLGEEAPAFFVLFSSVSGIVPSLASGQSDYAMANAYMDYAAQAYRGRTRMISIQWPNWKETGLGEVTSRSYRETGLLSHTNGEGLRLLDHILSRSDLGPVVLPTVIDTRRWHPGRLMQRSLRGVARTGEAAPAGRQTAAAASSAARGELLPAVQNWLADIFAAELKLDASSLEADTPFPEYGVDSIMLAQVLRTIRRLLGVELESSLLYEYPSIGALAARLAGGHEAVLRKLLEETIPGREGQDSAELAGVGGAHIGPEAVTVLLDAHPENPSRLEGAPGPNAGELAPGDVAVIGMSCRFPGATDLDAYWSLLAEGRSAIRAVPESRWAGEDGFYAGLLDAPRTMRTSYFHIGEEDARAMDPQAHLILEEALRTVCHAGYSPEDIKGRAVGVYIGARSRHEPGEESLRQARNPILAVGPNYLASNISQFFDLRGPSLVLDTACSSALVGMDLAVQALRSGEIDYALVGGVSLLGSAQVHRLFRQRGILSPGPRFDLFDGRAEGVVLSEGAGMVLLKRARQASAEGDRVCAVIKGIAVNNDGRTAGPATPSLQAQTDVIRRALGRSGRGAADIRYIEANGSGSEVTDLLELKAIQSVYRPEGMLPLGLGSAKPNIGHPLCAEGMAGFIKLALMLQHRELVPFLSGQEPMKYFDMGSSPFCFHRERSPWEEAHTAALNCFADGGTNVHVILEAGKEGTASSVRRHPLPVPASAMDTAAASPASGSSEAAAAAGRTGDRKTSWWSSKTAAGVATVQSP